MEKQAETEQSNRNSAQSFCMEEKIREGLRIVYMITGCLVFSAQHLQHPIDSLLLRGIQTLAKMLDNKICFVCGKRKILISGFADKIHKKCHHVSGRVWLFLIHKIHEKCQFFRGDVLECWIL